MKYQESLMKLVDCNNITYAYHCLNLRNVQAFSFENDELQLQRLLLTNFVDVNLVAHYTLAIPASETMTDLKQRLENFIEHFGGKNCTYLALLDLTKQFDGGPLAVVHLITNQSAHLDIEQLSKLWGNTVEWDISPFEDLLENYTKALNSVKNLHSEYLFTNNLEEPKVLYIENAYSNLNKNELTNSNCQNTFEIIDPEY